MKKILLIGLTAFLLVACQTKDSYVKDFTGFVEKVEMNMSDYSDKDWEKADDEFAKYSTTLFEKYEEELSPEEKAEVIKLQATYAGLKLKAGVKNAAKNVDKLLDGLKEGTK